mmetsp:Transcript_21160/g.25013  ORF Transcript_21160/g.25013 Transcript_21160/m.25013 type:complete len:148 (+) Transcript_21160:41-484(+)
MQSKNRNSSPFIKQENQMRYDKAISIAAQPSVSSRQRAHGLIMAAGEGNLDVVKRILELGVSPNILISGERKCALHAAVIFRQIECVEMLLNYGADVTLCDKHGKSALDLATETSVDLKNDDIYQLLKKHFSVSMKRTRDKLLHRTT